MAFVQISIEECFTGYKIIHCFCLYKQFFYYYCLLNSIQVVFFSFMCISLSSQNASSLYFLSLSLSLFFFFLVYVFVCECLSATYPIALFREKDWNTILIDCIVWLIFLFATCFRWLILFSFATIYYRGGVCKDSSSSHGGSCSSPERWTRERSSA